MYIKRHYTLFDTFVWSFKPFFWGLIYAAAVVAVDYFFPLNISFPWQPISVMGIAVAFYLGFKNNSSYDRTWEARKIWGSIVNNSRSFGAAVMAFTAGEEAENVKRELIFRHLAWLTALRHQLRLSRPWEHTDERLNNRYNPNICEDYNNKLHHELAQFISEEEVQQVIPQSNTATQILRIQSEQMQKYRDAEYYEDFRHMELHHLVVSFYEDQGKSERIKNFPFPRQYASTALWLTVVFSIFVPFGMLDVLDDSNWMTALLIPFISGLLTWIFFLMEKIGDYSENPFEGTYNDVPITSIARAIEIDLKEMLAEEKVPGPIKDENGFLM